jgi:hypothetical protein
LTTAISQALNLMSNWESGENLFNEVLNAANNDAVHPSLYHREPQN